MYRLKNKKNISGLHIPAKENLKVFPKIRVLTLAFFLISIFLFSGISHAQYPVLIHTNVLQPVPPYLPQLKADIMGNRRGQLNRDLSDHLSVTLTNTGSIQDHIKLAASIERVAPSPMGISLRSDYQPSGPIILNPQQMVHLNKDMIQNAFGNFSKNALVFTHMDLSTLQQNAVNFKLPEGTYKVCVSAFDYDKAGFSDPLSPPGSGCAYFTICYTASAPQLISPISTQTQFMPVYNNFPTQNDQPFSKSAAAGMALQAPGNFQSFTPHTSQIQFTWTPPVTTCGFPLGALAYDLVIRRVFDGQTITDALNNPPVFLQKNIHNNTFLLDTLRYPHVLVSGQRYIVRVKADFTSIPGSPLKIANQGYSQIGAFTYVTTSSIINKIAGNLTEDTTPVFVSGKCAAQKPVTNKVSYDSTLTGKIVTIDGFKMHVDNATQRKDSSYQGDGYITWKPFGNPLEIKVHFDSIRVNTEKTVFHGEVHTITAPDYPRWDPYDTAHPVDKMTSLSDGDYADINARITDGAHLINDAHGKAEMDLPLGVGTWLGNTKATLAIMSITFKPSCNKMNVLFPVEMPDLGGWIPLAGAGFQITPKKALVQDSVLLFLGQKHVVKSSRLIYEFLPCTDSAGAPIKISKGTYVFWKGKKGMQKINVNANLKIKDTTTVIPVDSSDHPLHSLFTLHLHFNFSDWKDWIASAAEKHTFEINGLHGYPIETTALFYDHSSKQNPKGIHFPKGFKDSVNSKFEGLYIPALTMEIPHDFKRFGADKKPVSFGFTNFILDDRGVSTYISANNIINLQTGDLGGWAFSIDSLKMGIVDNNFQLYPRIAGKIQLPLLNTPLDYSCNIGWQKGKAAYQFIMHPNKSIKATVWKATLEIDSNSNVIIKKDSLGFAINSKLNGKIYFHVDDPNLPEITIPGLTFQKLSIANRKKDTATHQSQEGFSFDMGKWSFCGMSFVTSGKKNKSKDKSNASDKQKKDTAKASVAGFPIGIKDIGAYFRATSLTEYEAGPKFTLTLNLGFGDKTVLGGSTSLAILGKVDLSKEHAPKSAYETVQVNKVTLNGDLGPVKVKGSLAFRNDDPVYGNGIAGKLSATFPFAAFNAYAQFGTIKGMHYWAAGGSVFLKTGVPIGPGLTINGFGGGIYHNMSIKTPSYDSLRNLQKKGAQTTKDITGSIKMQPKNGSEGMTATLIGAFMKPEVVNVALTLGAELHNGSLAELSLAGKGYIMSDPPKNDKAIANVSVQMMYDLEKKAFDAYIDAQFKILTAKVNAPIWIHGAQDGYYLYVGRPDQGKDIYGNKYSRVNFNLVNIGKPSSDLYVYLAATAYFDAGSLLPKFPDLPPDVQKYFGVKGNDDNTITSILKSMNASHSIGFMFGAGVQGKLNVTFLCLYAKGSAEAGFDMVLKKATNPPASCTNGNGSFGLDNWYALGQLYAYLSLEVGAHVDVWFFKGDISLLKLDAGALLTGGFVNPSWGKGTLKIDVSALGGLISVHGQAHFSFGNECYVPYNPLDKIKLITDAGPADSGDVFAMPYVAYSLPMNGKDFDIQVPPDQEHDQPYTRTYRFHEDAFKLYKVVKENTEGPAPTKGNSNDKDKINISGGKIIGKIKRNPHVERNLITNNANNNANQQSPAGSLPSHLPSGNGQNKSNEVDSLVKGSVQFTSDGLGSSFYHSSILEPHTKYKVYIKCHADEIMNNAPQLVKAQDTTFYFTTGGAPDHIVLQNVVYTYPIGNESYVLKNEFNGIGRIKLGQWQTNILPVDPSKYDYLLQFIPDNGGATIHTTFTPHRATEFLDFNLPPALQNNTTYTMQVWVVPHGMGADSNLKVNTTNQTKSYVQAGDTLNVTTRTSKVVEKSAGSPLGQKPIYTLKFHTSRYNTFKDKINAYGLWLAGNEDGDHNITLTSRLNAPEPFGPYEISGYTSACTTSHAAKKYPPMFGVSIPWNDQFQNDKFGDDSIYKPLPGILTKANMTARLGVPQLRDRYDRPVYAISITGMPQWSVIHPGNQPMPGSFTGKIVWTRDHYLYNDYKLLLAANAYLKQQAEKKAEEEEAAREAAAENQRKLSLNPANGVYYAGETGLLRGPFQKPTAASRIKNSIKNKLNNKPQYQMQYVPYPVGNYPRDIIFNYSYPFSSGTIKAAVKQQLISKDSHYRTM